MAKAIWRTGKIAFKVMIPVLLIALCIYGWKAIQTAHAQDISEPVLTADNDANIAYTQALALEENGDLSQAQAIYEQILVEEPSSRVAGVDRAAFRSKLVQCTKSLENGDITSARIYADQIKTLGGTASQAAARLYNLGAVFEKAKVYDDAVSLYQEVLTQEPGGKYAGMDYAKFHIMLVGCKQAIAQGDTATAQSYINQYVSQAITSGGSAEQTAKYLYNAGFAFETSDLYENAVAYYQQVIAEYPDSVAAGANYAAFQIQLAQCKRALRDYDTATAHARGQQIKELKSSEDRAPSQLYAVANEFAQAQYYDRMLSKDAIQLYQQLINQYPDSRYAGPNYAGFRLKLAQCKLSLKSGNVAEARVRVNEIKALNVPNNQKAEQLYNLGFAFDEVHELNDAAGLYKQAIAVCPNDPALVSKSAFCLKCIEQKYELLSSDVSINTIESRMATFDAGFENQWSMSAAVHAIGKCLYEAGARANSADPNKTMRLAKAAAIYAYGISHQQPGDAWLNDSRRGWMYYLQGMSLEAIGDYSKAADAYRNAYQANPKHQYADYLLYAEGNCYEKMVKNNMISYNEVESRINLAYSKLLQIYPRSPYIHDIRHWKSGE